MDVVFEWRERIRTRELPPAKGGIGKDNAEALRAQRLPGEFGVGCGSGTSREEGKIRRCRVGVIVWSWGTAMLRSHIWWRTRSGYGTARNLDHKKDSVFGIYLRGETFLEAMRISEEKFYFGVRFFLKWRV